MGQRHQLFVIAKVNGKYRSLAAVHHQWLYGPTALRRCRGLLDIFSNPKNAISLQEELKVAARKDSLWDRESSLMERSVKFPFIMTCLMLGASYDSQDGYLHKVHIEPFNMSYDEGDNNNGITIIDISDLNDVRYCFVDFFGMESEHEVPLMTPLSGSVYLAAYHQLDGPQSIGLMDIVEDLNPWKLVTAEALEDTWPDNGWQVSHPLSKLGMDYDLLTMSSPDRHRTTFLQKLLTYRQ